MIADVDASLRSLLRATALHDSKVEIVFDSPTRAWADTITGDVVDAYLWEIREDVARSRGDWEDVRDEHGRVTGRRPPLHHYKLRYLLTAWGKNPASEHRLLSSILGALADEQAIPSNHISGELASEGLPVFLSVALPPDASGLPWDLWGALGVAPRPALDLVAIAPLPRRAALPAGPPVRDRRISVAVPGGTPERVPTAIADERVRLIRTPR
jgi:Pvc16 N-terminal domain